MSEIISFDDGEMIDLHTDYGARRYIARFLKENGAHSKMFSALERLSGKRFFVDDPENDGYNEFKTENEAKEHAKRCIEAYLGTDGWLSDDVELICMGTVTHVVKDTCNDSEWTEYNLVEVGR